VDTINIRLPKTSWNTISPVYLIDIMLLLKTFIPNHVALANVGNLQFNEVRDLLQLASMTRIESMQ